MFILTYQNSPFQIRIHRRWLGAGGGHLHSIGQVPHLLHVHPLLIDASAFNDSLLKFGKYSTHFYYLSECQLIY